MSKFLQVLNDVHEFIVGRVETQPEKTRIGFSTDKPKRKYTRRKKKKWKQQNTLALLGVDLVNNSNL
jgi:hypothetical protein